MGKSESRLHPKAFAVLRHLVEHPGQLVTKETLLEAVWPKVYVADTVLSVYIAEIRKALGDNPKRPRFIETVHRRGYRFIAPVSTSPEPVSTKPDDTQGTHDNRFSAADRTRDRVFLPTGAPGGDSTGES